MLSKGWKACTNGAFPDMKCYDFNMNQRFCHIKVGLKKNGLITAIDDFSIADAGVPLSQHWAPTAISVMAPTSPQNVLISTGNGGGKQQQGKDVSSGQNCP
jgi:hypothetical protein